MQKIFIIIAHTGQEIIDSTPEAKNRIAAMDYLEERRKREYRWMVEEKRKLAKNPLRKLAAFCGLV